MDIRSFRFIVFSLQVRSIKSHFASQQNYLKVGSFFTQPWIETTFYYWNDKTVEGNGHVNVTYRIYVLCLSFCFCLLA